MTSREKQSTPDEPAAVVLHPDVLRLESLKVVKARVGLSEATIYRLLAAGKFPKAKRRVGTKSLWLSTDIDEWIKADDPDANVGQNMGQAA